MNGISRISDIPQIKDLQKQYEELLALVELWPLLKKQLITSGKLDQVRETEAKLACIPELRNQLQELVEIPDRFNDLFAEIGWILFNGMGLETAKEAIRIAEADGIERADEFLVDYFSADWVERHLILLKAIKGFEPRYFMAKMALNDYREERYYASALVVFTLIDGWVNELNIVDFHRVGFFSSDSDLVAWNSITAHPKGLRKLKSVLGQARRMTRTEEITIPYRNGIVHGMDLGYNNKYVAAKCWAALFAVRDWAVKAARNELNPPDPEPNVEKSLWESIEDYYRIQAEIAQFQRWKPRINKVVETFNPRGEPEDFPDNSPERKLVEFLGYWMQDNYGYMSQCFSPMLPMTPADTRQRFKGTKLTSFELSEIVDVMPTVADVTLLATIKDDEGSRVVTYEFRLICTDSKGGIAHVQRIDTIWGVGNWRIL